MAMFYCNYENTKGEYKGFEFEIPAEPVEIIDVVNALIPYIKKFDINVVDELDEDLEDGYDL